MAWHRAAGEPAQEQGPEQIIWVSVHGYQTSVSFD